MRLFLNSNWVGMLAILFCASTSAHAQRGEQTGGSPSQFTSPTQGFPGFFDTNFADKGSLVVEWPPIILPIIPMPSIEVDYGVSDTFTVGTNAIVTVVPWLLGAKGFSFKARTLFYGTDTVQNAATAYAGYIGAKNLAVTWQLFTSNNAWKVAPRHILSVQGMALHLGLEAGSKSSIDYTNIQGSTITLGGGYQFLINNSIALSTYVMLPAVTSFEADTVAANISGNLDARSGDLTWGVLRSSLDLRTTSCVYSIGGAYIYGLTKNISPWASAARRW
jgi:hypothetical protein